MVRRSERLAAKRSKTDHHQETTYVNVVNNNGLVDDSRISNLSNELLHHIFSFLDMDMDWVVRTSVLSKRWRYLWKSSPILNFCINADNISKSWGFVDHVLSKRDKKSKVEKLNLKSKVFLTHVCVRKWINAATIGTVDELSLDINVPESCWPSIEQFPDQVCRSGIKKLSLRCSQLSIPKSLCSAEHIKSLTVQEVRFPDGDSNGHLILNCPVLENLIVNNCKLSHLGSLTISTPQLKNLEFYDLYRYSECKTIIICCPKLTSLYWSRSIPEEISFKDISALTSVTLKDVCIDYRSYNDSQDELDFIKRLLEKGKVLAEMAVYFKQGLTLNPFSSARRLADFKQKVLALPRASSNLSISFSFSRCK